MCDGKCTGVKDHCHNKNYRSNDCLDFIDDNCTYKQDNKIKKG